MKNIILKARHTVPIYNVGIRLYVVRSVAKAMSPLRHLFSGKSPKGDCAGVCMSSGDGEFALIFEITSLCETFVGHELTHCTNQILDHIGHKLCSHCNNEPQAYISGYLHEWVRDQFRKAKIAVRVK